LIANLIVFILKKMINYKKLILIQRIVALLIILTLVAGLIVFYWIDNYPRIEVKKEVVTEVKVVKEKEYIKVNKYINKKLGYWDIYNVSAYTSLDEGCNNISAIGLDIAKWDKYFNFCAVDPELIPYGSTVLVEIEGKIYSFLAADCGYLIKGKKIDLYFNYDLDNAFKFGRRNLNVLVIESKEVALSD